jgi:hypothetical protein
VLLSGENNMTLEESLLNLTKRGWSFDIKLEKGKVYGYICHDSWVTKDLYQARPLPSFEANTISEIYDEFLKYFSK